MCASFPFGFEGGMSDLIVLVPDPCLSFFFVCRLYVKGGEWIIMIFTKLAKISSR